jgi:hypothetical protein
MTYREQRLLYGLLDSNAGKIRLKSVTIQVVTPWVAQMKTGIKFTKSTNTDKESIWRSLTG